ncbi:Dph6-related ATP pyrophosphatase [Moheibacter sediminis]|uniref:MJ0570-related uncharacterized domain-containing protein n=1 Tax=Moheibacter sediminis TaxID=1434700 RepID=A0A1W2BPD4_9FLAO|nr:diphthine--ammonia ligase [Moheibacter sediminis]SMC74398.1 MJ0570-related uncharacterized domain-containing protein [Moheibacter sediminis]
MKSKAVFNWSSGKDSALALYKILNSNQFEIVSLLTSVNSEFKRVSMHGLREELLEKQAESIGLPLYKVMLPERPSMEEYNSIMNSTLTDLKQKGITHSIFGDIFLEDLKKYREDKLNEVGLKAVFPLWKISTKNLIEEFISVKFKTIVICVNENYLDKSFVGRIINQQFLDDLPENVDPCGENGEFHTFTFDGPIFQFPINFTIGEIVRKTYPKPNSEASENTDYDYGFWFCDLIQI